MTDRLVYLIGAPGAGKSTLMARLTANYDREAVDGVIGPLAHDKLIDGRGEVVGAELGIRRGLFSGTDALPSAIIDRADPWIRTRPYPLVLGEGARLANRRFILAARDAGYLVTLCLLDHPDVESWRAQRALDIGREQNPTWVKGRTTASENLAESMAALDGVSVLRGHPDELATALHMIDPRLGRA